jgi:hypothetical protein
VEPLTADLRRLHLTVSKRFLEKLEAARDALSLTRVRTWRPSSKQGSGAPGEIR